MFKFYVFVLIMSCFSYTANAADLALHQLKDLEFKTENNRERVYLNGELFAGAVIIPDEQGRKVTYIYKQGEKNGTATAKYANDDIEIEINYLNNLKNGESIYFYPHKIPKMKETYKEGVLHGEKVVFYDNGKPKEQSFYDEGKLSGTVTSFDKNGNVLSITNYQNNLKNGIERIVENNILRKECNYVEGKLDGVCKEFTEKYLEKETNYKNDKQEGIQKIYHEDGSWKEIPYVNGLKEGKGTVFYPDGKINQQITYRHNAKNGITKSFYHDGKTKTIMRYKDDKLFGIARSFDAEGDLLQVHYFINGIKMSEVSLVDNKNINELYRAYQQGKLALFSQKKNLWYPILWLGLNQENHEILDILAKDMSMYAAPLGNEDIYRKFGKAKFDEYNRDLFFGMSPLSYALHLDAKTSLLQKFINEINLPNERGTTPLHEAVTLDEINIVKFLLLNHANVRATNNKNEEVIIDAIKHGADIEIISLLLEYGADINVKDADGYSPLMIAVNQRNVELIKFLLQHGANINELTKDGKNVLFYAYANHASEEIIQILLDSDIDVNLKDKNDNLMLIDAIKDNNIAFVNSLISKKADVNLTDISGRSALSYVLSELATTDEIRAKIIAAGKEFKENVPTFNKTLWNILLDQDDLANLTVVFAAMSDINTPDINGVNPLYTALSHQKASDIALDFVKQADAKLLWTVVESKQLDLLKKVLEKHPPINEKNADGQTVLTYMIKNNYGLEYIEAVESVSPDVNLTNKDGKDALELAVQNNNVELAKNLIEHGADLNRVIDGKTYLMIFNEEQEDMSKLFIEKKADLNVTAAQNTTMLMIAVSKLNIPLFEELIKNNVDVNAKDSDGKTAILYLSEALKNYPDMAQDELQARFRTIIEGLQNKGADINAQTNTGETLLMLIAQSTPEKFEIMNNFLTDLGLSAELKNQYGKSAADLIENK